MTKFVSETGVRLKQRIRFPLFERLFRRISILRGASRRGGGECYDTLAKHYGERIRCFTLTRETVSDSSMKQYLPWPSWVMQQEIETILSVLCHPRWPRQVNSHCHCHWHYCITFANVNTA